jgi:hypothetical protein
MVMQGFSPGLFQPQQGVYDAWLRSQLSGMASPLAYAFGQFNQPLAQLQYMTAPVTGTFATPGAGESPFRTFLEGMNFGTGGTGDRSPLDAAGWLNRAQQVTSALEGTAQDEATERLRQRFGMQGGAEAAANAVRLAQAPILSRSPLALRGETQAILDRSYQDWLADQVPGATQSYLGAAPTELWNRWGLGGP